jgi:hypothetical protein
MTPAWVLILIFRGALQVFSTDIIGTAYFATEKACVDAAEAAILARHGMKFRTGPHKGQQQIDEEGLYESYVCMPITDQPEQKP